MNTRLSPTICQVPSISPAGMNWGRKAKVAGAPHRDGDDAGWVWVVYLLFLAALGMAAGPVMAATTRASPVAARSVLSAQTPASGGYDR